MVQPVHLLGIGLHRLGHRLRRYQLVFDAGQNPRLDLLAGDGPAIVAGAAPVVVEAGIAARCDDAELAAAASAGEKAGQQRNGPDCQMQPLHPPFERIGGVRAEDRRDLLLAVSDCLPEIVFDHSQMRHFRPDPLAFRVGARDALTSGWVLDEPLPVPDEDAGVKLVVENAGAARDMAANAGVAPCASKRTGNAFTVQIGGNRLRAFTAGELSEDAADDVGFLGNDLTVAPDRLAVPVELFEDTVAVAKPATGLALFHPAPQSAMRLHREVFKEQRVHRAFQADMKLGDFSLGQGDNGNACKLQVLVECGNIGLIAADAIQCLGNDHREQAV